MDSAFFSVSSEQRWNIFQFLGKGRDGPASVPNARLTLVNQGSGHCGKDCSWVGLNQGLTNRDQGNNVGVVQEGELGESAMLVIQQVFPTPW